MRACSAALTTCATTAGDFNRKVAASSGTVGFFWERGQAMKLRSVMYLLSGLLAACGGGIGLRKSLKEQVLLLRGNSNTAVDHFETH